MGKINEKELEKLFIEIKHNNKLALEKLYNQYSKLVYGICFSILKNKQDAEDMVQSIFIKIDTIDKNKLPSKNEATWLYSVAKNETINFLKRKNSEISIECLYEIEDDNNEINKIIDQDSYNRLISRLNDEEKEIISLKILGDFSFDEIGKILNKPTGTVKWKYYKSINTLKILLGNLGMFVVSFISSIIAFNNGAKKSDLNEEVTDIEDNNLREDEEIKGSPTKEDKNEDILLDAEEQTEQNTTVETPVISDNTNYIGISLMSISIFFLIITIIFSIIFTKHQLKRNKKVSK